MASEDLDGLAGGSRRIRVPVRGAMAKDGPDRPVPPASAAASLHRHRSRSSTWRWPRRLVTGQPPGARPRPGSGRAGSTRAGPCCPVPRVPDRVDDRAGSTFTGGDRLPGGAPRRCLARLGVAPVDQHGARRASRSASPGTSWASVRATANQPPPPAGFMITPDSSPAR